MLALTPHTKPITKRLGKPCVTTQLATKIVIDRAGPDKPQRVPPKTAATAPPTIAAVNACMARN